MNNAPWDSFWRTRRRWSCKSLYRIESFLLYSEFCDLRNWLEWSVWWCLWKYNTDLLIVEPILSVEIDLINGYKLQCIYGRLFAEIIVISMSLLNKFSWFSLSFACGIIWLWCATLGTLHHSCNSCSLLFVASYICFLVLSNFSYLIRVLPSVSPSSVCTCCIRVLHSVVFKCTVNFCSQQLNGEMFSLFLYIFCAIILNWNKIVMYARKQLNYRKVIGWYYQRSRSCTVVLSRTLVIQTYY